MKYEITKGNEKDFEGSPDGCVKVFRGTDCNVYVWGNGEWENEKVKGCAKGKGSAFKQYDWLSLIAERRPITELVVNRQLTTEWDGEYPIPAGVNVEVHFDGDDSRVWTEFRVEYMRGDVVVLYDYRSDGVESWPNARLSFRPIRSPEDVARSNAIGEMERAYEELTGNPAREAEEYYDLIAAGKIKGVVLESKLADLKINITTDEMWREFEKKSDMEDVRKLVMKTASRRGSF